MSGYNITRPDAEQLVFTSNRTGEHALDVYLQNAELGNRTLADLLSDIFDSFTGAIKLPGVGTLAVLGGGTGATTAAGARTNLGATALGSSLFTAADVAAAQAALSISPFGASMAAAVGAASARTVLGAAASGANTDITSLSGLLTINGGPASGRLIGVQVFSTVGTFTYNPTAGTTSVVAAVQAGGGAGGGGGATGAGQVDVGAGGAGGGYAMSRLVSGFSGATVIVGAGGVASAGGNGGNGGSSSFGGLLSATGGGGGVRGGVLTVSAVGDIQSMTNGNVGVGAGGNIRDGAGGVPTDGLYLTRAVGGHGGGSAYGPGGSAGIFTANNGASAVNHGSGGGGVGLPSSTPAYAGGNGKSGIVIVWEYA